MQWRNEIEAHTDGMKVLVWHGSSRETNVAELQKHDVVGVVFIPMTCCLLTLRVQVLTTYAILERSAVQYFVEDAPFSLPYSVFRKQVSGFKRKGNMIKEKSPIHDILWNRVIVSSIDFLSIPRN